MSRIPRTASEFISFDWMKMENERKGKMSRIDLGRLTQEETYNLVLDCFGVLTDEMAIKAIVESFKGDDLEELIASLEASREDGQ